MEKEEKKALAVEGARETYHRLIEGGWNEGVIQDFLKTSVNRYMPLLRLQNISKQINGRDVLQNISLEIYPGEIFGLVGLGGSGKTALLQAIVGYRSCSGDILLRQEEGFVSARKRPDLLKNLIGFSPQKNSFYPEFSVKENLVHFSLLYGFGSEKAELIAESLIDDFSMDRFRDVLAKDLSPGIKKLLDIICALVHDPQLLILDEPAADLDDVSQKRLWKILRNLNAQGKSILISTHHPYVLENVCHRIGFLHNGSLVKTGTFEDLAGPFLDTYELFIQTTKEAYDLLAQAFENLGYPIRLSGKGLIVYTKSPGKTLSEAGTLIDHANDTIVDIRLVKPGIQEFASILTHE